MSRLLTCQALVILLFDLVFVYISIRMVLCSLPVTSWPFPSLNIYKCIFTWVTIAEQHYYSNREVAYLLKFDVVSPIAFVFWCRRSLDGKRLHFNFFISIARGWNACSVSYQLWSVAKFVFCSTLPALWTLSLEYLREISNYSLPSGLVNSSTLSINVRGESSNVGLWKQSYVIRWTDLHPLSPKDAFKSSPECKGHHLSFSRHATHKPSGVKMHLTTSKKTFLRM